MTFDTRKAQVMEASYQFHEERWPWGPPGQVPPYAMRVAPGTDAVVWKPWDTSHVECEL